ncbi:MULTISPECIES: hypothetical protein [unclassified Streptomyces]|uniref:hypothetical protein n=1 Tax=unclassified Streptomyces TaxID=2593676 RepID=UPI0014879C9F|nr:MULTISPECIES: hypothetical protein [unclassified Streptomyces]
MPKWALTATSRTGQKVNPFGGDTDTVTVYDKADLDRRVKADKTDPRDLDVKVERLS